LGDKSYAWFLVMQMAGTAGRAATPFYAIYVTHLMTVGGEVHGAVGAGAFLGVLGLCFIGADAISNLVWGYMGDKTGFKLVLVLSMGISIASTVLLMTVHAPWAFFLAFFGLGGSQSGYMMAAQTMILEFGSREEMPMRIAISSMAEGIMASLGPLVAGVMADQLGYGAVFGTSIAFLTAALMTLLVFVKEPRTARLARA
jgi:MFS family permease